LDCKVENTVPIKSVVKAAAIDLGEDYLRVDTTFSHWAARGLKKLSREILRGGLKRELLNVHKNFKTVKLPIDFEKEAFVGFVDDCGHKHALFAKGYIAATLADEDCSDQCEKCNQDLDICEDLVTDDVVELVTFPNGPETYEKRISKFIENGKYLEVTTTPVWNMTTEEVEYNVSKKFITEFDMLECGCVAKTEENIAKIKDKCYDTYCKCYAPCAETQGDLGGYKIFEEEGIIQFDKSFAFDKIYLEYYGSLPKIKGQFHVPKVAFETLVAFIKFKFNQHKKSVTLQERRELERYYITEKENMNIILCRISLSDIIDSVRRIPKFEINGNPYCLDAGGSTFYISAKKQEAAPAITNITNTTIVGGGVSALNVTMPEPSSGSYQNNAFSGKSIVSIFREGQVLNPATWSLVGTTVTFNNGDTFEAGVWYQFLIKSS
jgi:hypothetical protein